MIDDRPMSAVRDAYLRGAASRAELESAIFTFIRDNPWRFKLERWDRDKLLEFLSWFYPSIRNAIDTYRDCGSSFDAYLNSLVHWASLGYRIRNFEEDAMESAYWTERAVESTRDPEATYEPDIQDEAEAPPTPEIRKRRQVLALTLKCCMFVSDDLCGRIAPALSMQPAELRTKIGDLRTRVQSRYWRRKECEEKAATQYYRCIVLKAKIDASAEGSARRSKYERSLAFARKRLKNLRREISKIPIEASNKEVADVLGVPKGTVDASIYFLKHSRPPLPSKGAERLS